MASLVFWTNLSKERCMLLSYKGMRDGAYLVLSISEPLHDITWQHAVVTHTLLLTLVGHSVLLLPALAFLLQTVQDSLGFLGHL
jgi:hypothetical protein